MFKKLKKKGYNEEESLEIISRYVDMRNYKCEIDYKVWQRKSLDSMLRICEKTGMEQWELRAMVEQDTGIEM